MKIRPIHDDTGHAAALARIETLWNAKPGTAEEDEFDVLTVLVTDYENKRWPILPPDPVDAIRFHMDQNGWRQKDLAKVLGSESRASEILHRRRKLSMHNIGAIHRAWGIPLEALFHTEGKAPKLSMMTPATWCGKMRPRRALAPWLCASRVG